MSQTCAVLVVSSDGYKDLWPPFFRLFSRYWPDCPFPLFLGSGRETFEYPGVRHLHCGDERAWGAGLRFFLNKIDFDYVLLLLEDFFLTEPVSSPDMLRQVGTLAKLGGTNLRLKPDPPPTVRVNDHPELGEVHRLAPYRVSLQPGIWHRNGLLALLRDEESPWEFEERATIRSQAQPSGFYCTRRAAFPSRHVIEKGRWFWSAARHYRRERDLGCSLNARAAMPAFTAARKALLRALRRSASHLLTMPLRARSDAFAPQSSEAARVAILTNLIPPYHKPVLDLLAERYPQLRLFLSTRMEANRPWEADWSGLDVVLQKTYTFRGQWNHPRGFSEPLAIHVPVDTFAQLSRFSPSVVISAEMGVRTLVAMLFAKTDSNTRFIIWAETSEATESGRGKLRWLLRRLLVASADGFLAVGTSAANYLKSIGAKEERIFRIAYTTSLDAFSAANSKRKIVNAKTLLYCGQLIARKGLIPFLTALSKWASEHNDETVEILVVGDGPLRGAVESFPRPGNVHLKMFGALQYDQLPEIYSQAGVFVLPTLADTWAVVVNEAMAAGLPVLGSSYAQAVTELVRDGVNGWIFRPDAPGKTYAAIDRALQTPIDELDRMREEARRTALSNGPEHVAEAIAKAIDSKSAGACA